MIGHRLLPLVALPLLLSSACQSSDVTSIGPQLRASHDIIRCVDTCDPEPGPGPGPSPGGVPIVASSGFSLASDGVYEWDGNPPIGDLDPARAYSGRTLAESPNKTFGVQLGGSVFGDFYFDGDDSKIKLVFSATTADGTKLYYNSEAGHDWRRCSDFIRCTGTVDEASERLNLSSYTCGVKVEVGGTGWARKSMPFGLSVGTRIWRIISLRAPNTWAETSVPLPANTDPGPLCSPAGGGGGGELELPPSSTPTGEYVTLPDANLGGISCEKMEYHLVYRDGTVSESWYAWQCQDGTLRSRL